jgi:N-acetylmuramoyl-L-alanine amidase
MNIGEREIDRWHRQKGWLMIGYHFVITRDGRLQKGRDINEIGAHVKGYNHKSVGVCMVGGYAEKQGWPGEEWKSEDNFTPAQWSVLKLVVGDLLCQYPDAKVVGHRDLEPHKECPSFDVAAWMERASPTMMKS